MQIERQEGIIRLSGDLRHSDAAALALALAEGLAQGDLKVADAGVGEASFGVIQTLISAGASARELERNLHLDLPESSALRGAARMLGIGL